MHFVRDSLYCPYLAYEDLKPFNLLDMTKITYFPFFRSLVTTRMMDDSWKDGCY